MAGRDPIVTPLQAAVHRTLDEISRGLDGTTPPLGAEFTRRTSARLVEALRAVLAEHRLDASGHCELCHGRRSWFAMRRRGPLPCRAYLAAQLALGAAQEDATTSLPAARHHHHRRSGANLHFAS
ncbi:hypothetical protein [Prauserella muralis]|uniref:Uncharacterized protein n=1 Tax=Prauserella muralis TaxID=588067 RepID=A0A2V4B1M5_9PSEU|nr:hypothetical protein [Prauserella muralis]PXY28056.1 hypothetical protein BAY60_17090 [Prauserella muralis]TWE22148.1 hypothetical protein FHX69_3382 [Prauserella muralis]